MRSPDYADQEKLPWSNQVNDDNKEHEGLADEWPECEPGTLPTFRREHHAALKRRTLVKALGGTAAVACLFVAGLAASQLSWSTPTLMAKSKVSAESQEKNSAAAQIDGKAIQLVALSCKDVLKLGPDYFDDKVSPEQKRLTNEHLRKCPKCRKKYEQEAKRRGQLLELALVIPLPQPSWVLFAFRAW